jgi:hypothetical protein
MTSEYLLFRKGVTKSPNMKYLDVAANKLSRDAAKIVTPCTRTLETIDLSNNNIDNEGGVTLAKLKLALCTFFYQLFRNLVKPGCTIHTLGLTSCNIEGPNFSCEVFFYFPR